MNEAKVDIEFSLASSGFLALTLISNLALDLAFMFYVQAMLDVVVMFSVMFMLAIGAMWWVRERCCKWMRWK